MLVSKDLQRYDVIVLGAGAAGLFAAFTAGRRGRSVLVLDHADRPGKKILISGGGRCNFTNLHASPANYLSENPHFAKSALARYTPADFLALVHKHRIPYHEKTLGQLFCDRTAHDILNLLLAECEAARVRLQTNTTVTAVEPASAAANVRYRVRTTTGDHLATSVIVATGGLSIPKLGATGLGYQIARDFDLPLVDPRPALVPFTFSPQDADHWVPLAGVSTGVTATALPARPNPRRPLPVFPEKLLFTHRGLSGPAILQVSSYWQPGESILLDLAPGRNVTHPLLAPGARRDAANLLQTLRAALPARLADRWLQLHPPTGYTNAALQAFEQALHSFRLIPAGTEGFAKAEVTAGGVDTAVLDARTLAARNHPGLHFIGEVVDVTGWLGGYNFQWAWASANAAGEEA
ncbi:MAG: aminoacetone oxidase family FAD-binding enzyme [Acidobacteriota bacterium]|nr:aminoacetone oxidase family FAD-binding enzyme [Acidobacteriota bacterium]